MQDGLTSCMDVILECPKCHQENVVRVTTGHEIQTLRKSIACVHCTNPWIEFLPGQFVSGPIARTTGKQ